MYFLIFVLEDANAVAILFHCFFDRPSTVKLFKSKKFPVDIYLRLSNSIEHFQRRNEIFRSDDGELSWKFGAMMKKFANRLASTVTIGRLWNQNVRIIIVKNNSHIYITKYYLYKTKMPRLLITETFFTHYSNCFQAVSNNCSL